MEIMEVDLIVQIIDLSPWKVLALKFFTGNAQLTSQPGGDCHDRFDY